MIAKVCGITRLGDALHAVEHGATAVGFVFWPDSPRYIAPERAAAIIRELPETVASVGVFVNQAVDEIERAAATARITTIQLHGDEPPSYATELRSGAPKSTALRSTALGGTASHRSLWRAMSVANANGALAAWPADVTILLDAHDPVRRGGTGQAIDWRQAAGVAARRHVILAGGLTPENVHEAITTVRPLGVDVASGVEEAPGVKNLDKVARFLERARAAFDAR